MNAPIATVMCLLQMAGICGTVIAAAVKVETLMITGPILCVLGVAIACSSVSAGSRSSFLFGGSASAMGIFLFLLIKFAQWQPAEAQLPVTVMLLIYELVFIPIGLIAFFKLLTCTPEYGFRSVRRFDLWFLLGLVTICAVTFGTMTFLIDRDVAVPMAVAISIGCATLLGIHCVSKIGTGVADRSDSNSNLDDDGTSAANAPKANGPAAL